MGTAERAGRPFHQETLTARGRTFPARRSWLFVLRLLGGARRKNALRRILVLETRPESAIVMFHLSIKDARAEEETTRNEPASELKRFEQNHGEA